MSNESVPEFGFPPVPAPIAIRPAGVLGDAYRSLVQPARLCPPRRAWDVELRLLQRRTLLGADLDLKYDAEGQVRSATYDGEFVFPF